MAKSKVSTAGSANSLIGAWKNTNDGLTYLITASKFSKSGYSMQRLGGTNHSQPYDLDIASFKKALGYGFWHR